MGECDKICLPRRCGDRTTRPAIYGAALSSPASTGKCFHSGSSLRSEVNSELNFPPQTSRGSFSAVSTPIFASKYSLESSRRDLHNALLCTVLQSQFFRQKSPKLFRD